MIPSANERHIHTLSSTPYRVTCPSETRSVGFENATFAIFRHSTTSSTAVMATDIHALPPEIIGLIADWIGAMEAVENKRLLGSERRMCICRDEEEERYYELKETRRDIRFHSDILKLSSLSHYLRNSIFESRKARGISMPFYRSALDRCEGIRDDLREGVR